MIVSRSVYMVMHPRGSYIVYPLLSLEWRHQKINQISRRCHPYASPLHKRFLVGCSSPFMRLAKHLTALRAWCKQMSAWSAKTRRAPSRHCRDARVYGHTTTAMHDNDYTPPPPPDVYGIVGMLDIRKTSNTVRFEHQRQLQR